MNTSAKQVPVAVERAQGLWVEIDARVQQWPRSARPLLGDRVVRASHDLLEALLRATYARGAEATAQHLANAGHHAAMLRLLLRGAHARRYLAPDAHEHVQRSLHEIGAMIGGWTRDAKARSRD
ncbi:MAG: four helix bundle protein [Polyangiales bacterium]